MTDLYPKKPEIEKDLVIKSCKTCIHEEPCPTCCSLSNWQALPIDRTGDGYSITKEADDKKQRYVKNDVQDRGVVAPLSTLQCPECGTDDVAEGIREIDGTPIFLQ